MTIKKQHGSSTCGSHRRAVDSALALAIVLVPAFAASRSALGQTFTTLYSFTGGTDGGSPKVALIRDAAGNLYGTTFAGGTAEYGVVFKIDLTTDKETVLHSFTGPPEGAYPQAGLVLDAAGNLYGTTSAGGNSTNCSGGCGTVFRVAATGTETVLHSFTGPPADGSHPQAGLFLDAGNLYGTTYKGGAYGRGTIFELHAATGTETPLYSFGQFNGDGLYPSAVLIADGAILYGTTQAGGTSEFGTVFEFDTTGNKETVLYSFKGYPDGATPESGLTQDAAGTLYGTTSSGGTGAGCLVGCGTVFKLDAAGIESVLYNLGGSRTDGSEPVGGLVLDAEGNVYGATLTGGALYYGTVFKVDQAGQETVSYSLNPLTQGAYPVGGLIPGGSIPGEKNHYYGCTSSGALTSPVAYGTVFEFIP